jgi:hypothetical protein
MARCWGTLTLNTTVQSAFDGGILYTNDTEMKAVEYPIPFSHAPSEIATVKSPSGTLTWLASCKENDKEKTGLYRIISPYKYTNKSYGIVLDAKGYVDKAAWNE